MTRTATGDTVQIAPSNNIYTVLTGLATLAVLLGLIVLLVRAHTLGIDLWKM